MKQGDDPVERGDIVVTEEKAKLLSQPKADPPTKNPKQNARTKTDPKAQGGGAVATPPAPPADQPPPAAEAPPADGKRTVRTVGPPQMVSPR